MITFVYDYRNSTLWSRVLAFRKILNWCWNGFRWFILVDLRMPNGRHKKLLRISEWYFHVQHLEFVQFHVQPERPEEC